jgi:hypothetical protein
MRDLFDLRGWLLLGKAWHLRRVVVTALLSALAWLIVPPDPVAVPARDGVESLLWPLVPTLVAGALPAAMAAAYRDSELTAARSRTQLRGVALLVTLALSLAPSVVAGRFDILVVWRNTGFLYGLALLVITVQPQSVAWLPVSAVPMWMWLLGTDFGGAVKNWAVLLHPSNSMPAFCAALLVFLLGVAAYWSIRAPRGSETAIDA